MEMVIVDLSLTSESLIQAHEYSGIPHIFYFQSLTLDPRFSHQEKIPKRLNLHDARIGFRESSQDWQL